LREVRPQQSSKNRKIVKSSRRAMVVASESERLDRELNSLIDHETKKISRLRCTQIKPGRFSVDGFRRPKFAGA
jgi:hypothetical protein